MASVSKREWTYKGETKTAWVVRYSDHDGRRKMKTFEKKKDADAFRLQVENAIADGGPATMAQISISDLCERYLRNEEIRVKDGRIGASRYRFMCYTVTNLIQPYLGRIALSDLTAERVEEWYNELCKDRGMVPRSAKDRVSNLGLIVGFAVSRKWVKSNVVKEALRRLRGVKIDPIRTFTKDEIAALLNAAGKRRKGQHEASARFIECCVHIAAFCGLRRGEILGLTLENVDFERRLIKVRHSLTDMDELKGPKTAAGKRDVPAPRHVLALIRNWIDRFYIENDRRLIFRMEARPYRAKKATARRDQCPHRNFHQQHWHKLLEQAGLWEKGGDHLHFHALRHFAASFWIENGMPLMDVASLLGHAKFDMTLQVYAHPIVGGNQRQDMLDRVSGLLLDHSATTIEATAIVVDATRPHHDALRP